MSKGPQTPGAGNQADVVKKCSDESCKQKGSRAGFCEEHFIWFKEGLLTTEGQRPRDFDKKYQAFLQRKIRAA
jgi:hypothetical protein